MNLSHARENYCKRKINGFIAGLSRHLQHKQLDIQARSVSNIIVRTSLISGKNVDYKEISTLIGQAKAICSSSIQEVVEPMAFYGRNMHTNSCGESVCTGQKIIYFQ